jgi:colanic acid biosynthesis protein WcaH
VLSLVTFKQVVEHAPLFAIDFVVVNERNQILVGRRKNAPAKNYWFVPGGRVYKNESLEDAFVRISNAELGLKIARDQAWLLGLYDHFYNDSFFSTNVSTHYINATHAIRNNSGDLNLSKEQHKSYRWLSIEDLIDDKTVHKFSKIYTPQLIEWLNNHD